MDGNRGFSRLPRWDCQWYWVEVVWTLRISDKILWWAGMTGIDGHSLLKIMLRVFNPGDIGRQGSLQYHLETDEGYGHMTPMSDLVDWRIKSLGCPSPEEVMAAGLGDPTEGGAWIKVHEHQKACLGSCGSEVEYLGRYARELAVLKDMRILPETR